MRYLSNALRDLGHEVDLISGPPYPIVDEGVRLIKLPSLDLYSLNSYQRLFINPTRLTNYPNFIEWFGTVTGSFAEPLSFGMRAYKYLCRREGKIYDVVHDNQTLSYGVIDIQKYGYPVVETIHHPVTIDRDIAIRSAKTLKDRFGYRRWFSFIKMQIKVAQQLSHIITVSNMARQHISEVFEIPADKLHVIYNGVDTILFSPADTVKRLDSMILMVMSRDTAVKGLSFLIEAIAELKSKYELKLVVVGKTLGDNVTEDLMDRLGVAENVTFTNQIDTTELVRLYRSATLVAIPSTYEGFGLPAAEAMACGAPVVSTTAGALPEVVGDAGILVPPADSKALAHAIAHLLNHPAECLRYSMKGRQRILDNFNWKNTAKQTEEIYLSAIDHASFYSKHSPVM